LLEERELAGFHLKDSSHTWLDRLRSRRDSFDGWLAKTRQLPRGTDRLGVLEEQARVYAEYDRARSEVIGLQDRGEHAKAEITLERRVTPLGDPAYELCERYIDAHAAYIDGETATADQEMRQVTLVVTIGALLTIVMGAVLVLLFFGSVLLPLQRWSLKRGSSPPQAERLPAVHPTTKCARWAGTSAR
jgi:hypothetical protein